MWASQARDEGSIPFTRSIDNQRLAMQCSKSAVIGSWFSLVRFNDSSLSLLLDCHRFSWLNQSRNPMIQTLNSGTVKILRKSGKFLPVLVVCLFFLGIHCARASAFYGTAQLWPGGNVYYTFDSSVSALKQRVFLDSAAEWALFANLHFTPRSTQANYVTIVETNFLGNEVLEGGVSAVGIVGGQQFIYFSSNVWNHGTICHELGHTLGLAHEHQRSDRDSYLTIITANVVPGGMGGLVKLTGTRNETPYDFLSIMHYTQWSGSINPPTLATMVPLPQYSQFANIMGEGDPILTPYDRAGMAVIYGAGPTLTNVVTNTQDSGPGSLRAALYYAYDNPSTTVKFNIPISDPGFQQWRFQHSADRCFAESF